MARGTDFLDGPTRDAFGNRAFAAGGLAIDVTTTKFKTVNTVPFTIDGRWYSNAAATAIVFAPPTGYPAHYVQPDLTTVYYVVAVDSSGNEKTIQGDYLGRPFNDPTTGVPRAGDGNVPDVPSSLCPIGILKVITNGSAFAPNTTALNAAGVTVTYIDVAGLPAANP